MVRLFLGMPRFTVVLCSLMLSFAARPVDARPPASKSKPTKARPAKTSKAKVRKKSGPLKMQGGTLRKATGMPRLGADQKLAAAAAAKVLGVASTSLQTKITLSPATPKVGSSVMRFYCPTYVQPDTSRAQFMPGEFDACSYRTGVGLRFRAKSGRRYLIDCAGTPGSDVQWKLRPMGSTVGGAQTAANTEHPAFIFEAAKDGEVALDFNASTELFVIHRCEITPTAD